MGAVRLDKLVLDERITPRARDEASDIQSLVDAIDAGVLFPPLLVDKASLRVVDGRRRLKAYLRRKWKHAGCTLREFPGGLLEMLKEGARANAAHGQAMGPLDHLAMIRRAEALGGGIKDVAEALSIPLIRLEELRVSRTATAEDGTVVDLKPGLRDLAGTVMTPRQVEENRRMPANDPIFMLRRAVGLLGAGLIPRDEEHDAVLGELLAAIQKHLGR